MERDDELMPLMHALRILAESHTRDDDLTGFVVMHGASPRFVRESDWIKAWASVRHAIGMAAFPPIRPASQDQPHPQPDA